MTDPAAAPLEGADRALVAYALKLTRTPREMYPADVEALRAAGLSEEEIFEAAFLTAYFNYTNRVAEGLGVEPEPGATLAPPGATPLHCRAAYPRRGGGTGRREGLKNLWAHARGGSIPPPGTINRVR